MKCGAKDGIQEAYIFQTSDFHYLPDGSIKMKRKYGKFKRQGFKVDFKKKKK